MIRAAAVIAVLCATAAAQPGSPGADHAAAPATPPRVAYLAGLLAAVRATPQAALTNTSNYVYAVERNKCQAPSESLHVGCLLEAATRNCQQGDAAAREQCRRVSDVIVTNRLSEKTFLPDDVRYQIIGSRRDYRTQLARELHRRYAILVAELAMSPQFPGSAADDTALAAGIEGYCRAVAGSRELSWQYCAAAVVWFIATDGRAVTL